MEKYKLNAIFTDDIKKFCHQSKDFDYIEVIEWKNNEGFDVNFSTRGSQEQRFSMTYGEWKVLKTLVKQL